MFDSSDDHVQIQRSNMPAYKTKMGRTCEICKECATHKVFNTYNALMGYFYEKCANKEIERLNK
jgi:hypothetical protein